MSQQRPNLGFDAELEAFDPKSWTPSKSRVDTPRPKKDQIQQAANAAGFQSREAAAKPTQKQTRRRRTGRNAQLNIKTTPETINAFYRLADANDWGLGETLEHAIALLEGQQKP
tara:strand:+ start:1214 stop:1555 length:342 start_codon:yes stop_codon:yes gene_type:complete